MASESTDADILQQFLMTAASKLQWGELANDVVMDVGCGIGLNSTIYLVDLFPKISKVIAIDKASDLVKSAILQNMSRVIEFQTADIEDMETLSPWEEQIPKIISVDCFNWLANQRTGFRNIFSLLHSGGTAAILTSINSPYQDTLNYLLKNTNWQHTELGSEAQFPRFPNKKMDSREYKELVVEIGFQIIYWEEYNRAFSFPSMEDFYNKGREFICPLLIHIPKEQQGEFKQDFFQAFTAVNGLSPDRKPYIKLKTVCMFLRKP